MNNYFKNLLDEKARRKFARPEDILKEVGVKPGMTVADLGCGAGFYVIPAARTVKNSGKVYAVDILDYMLEVTENKVKKQGFKNVEIIRADIEIPGATKIKKSSCDLVIISNILFQVAKKNEVFGEAFRIVKRGGIILVIDWEADTPLGPDKEMRFPKNQAKDLAEGFGLKLDREINAGNYHYGIIFKK